MTAQIMRVFAPSDSRNRHLIPRRLVLFSCLTPLSWTDGLCAMIFGLTSCCTWRWLQMSECPLRLGAGNNDFGGIVRSRLQHARHEASFSRDIPVTTQSDQHYTLITYSHGAYLPGPCPCPCLSATFELQCQPRINPLRHYLLFLYCVRENVKGQPSNKDRELNWSPISVNLSIPTLLSARTARL